MRTSLILALHSTLGGRQEIFLEMERRWEERMTERKNIGAVLILLRCKCRAVQVLNNIYGDGRKNCAVVKSDYSKRVEFF